MMLLHSLSESTDKCIFQNYDVQLTTYILLKII